jgi:hypothetical protein
VRFDKLRKRVSRLETKSSISSVTLHFPDGSSRALQMRDPLQVWCDAMRLASWAIGPPCGMSDGAEVCDIDPEKPFYRIQGAARPQSRHDDLISLLGTVETVDCEDSLVLLVHEMAQQALEVNECPNT